MFWPTSTRVAPFGPVESRTSNVSIGRIGALIHGSTTSRSIGTTRAGLQDVSSNPGRFHPTGSSPRSISQPS